MKGKKTVNFILLIFRTTNHISRVIQDTLTARVKEEEEADTRIM